MNGKCRGGLTVVAFCIFGLNAPPLRAQAPQDFVSVIPCRLVDTRYPAGPFGGPVYAAGETRTYTVPNGGCSIPSNAAAYALNITAMPTGPLGFITIWPTGDAQPTVSTLNSPSGTVIANGAIIPAGTNGGINVFASNPTGVIVDINGYFVTQSSSTSTALGAGASNAGTQNTAVGFNALASDTAAGNTGVGAYALTSNSTGNNNVAIGTSALLSNASGSSNTAVGAQALLNDFASDNTAVGFNALMSNTVGASNTALGLGALYANTGGSYNVALGENALNGLTSGSSNIAIGYQAGNQAQTTGNDNIFIGNAGQSTDNGVIRIGTAVSQTSAFIAGVYSTNVSGPAVLVNASGQLGVAQSAQRYKEDIQDMETASDGLMLLRPVTFRYKHAYQDGSRPVQYGLIGEEVAKVYPELVFRAQDGQVQSVLYQQLPALLLNEFQKQHRVVGEQQREIEDQKTEIHELESRIAALEALVKARGVQ